MVTSLPAELLDHCLSLLPPTALQSTALSLTRALPHSHLSHALIWRHLHLTREGQPLQATRKLRELPGLKEAVRTAIVEVWRDDPQLLVNLLLTLPNLTSLHLAVGPLFAPEHLDELLQQPKWQSSIEQIWFRFNPYVTQRSYYTFLKGTYFDAIPLLFSTHWTPTTAPNLRRLAFCQDLLPNHGVERKETPAFGLHEVEEALDQVAGVSGNSTPNETARVSRRGDEDKLSFAQPIVFHRLFCLTTLSLSPLGAQLTSLTLRLPRRNVLTSLTSYPLPASPFAPPPAPFPSLVHLDLSTTMIGAGDMRLPLMLRLMPKLEHLVLDRCTGFIGSREAEEMTALAAMRWIGKVLGGIPSSRAEEALRAWRRIVKDRPTFLPAPGPGAAPPATASSTGTEKKKRVGRSGYGMAPRMGGRPSSSSTTIPTTGPSSTARAQATTSIPSLLIRDLQIFPPPPTLLSLSLGLFPLEPRVASLWRQEFTSGWRESVARTLAKMEEYLHRYEVWSREGKLELPVGGEGNEGRQWARRMVGFRREVERVRGEAGLSPVEDSHAARGGEDEDEPFAHFLQSRGLVLISPVTANLLHLSFLSLLSSSSPSFTLCLTPSCPSNPGIPHLSLAAGQTHAAKESLHEREAREKGFAEQEAKERQGWRRPKGEHEVGCGHLWAREVWREEE